MPTDPPKRSVWPTMFVGMVLLAVAYGAAYLSLMKPVPIIWRDGPAGAYPQYPVDSLKKLFAPAEWLDRKIRRQFWESTP